MDVGGSEGWCGDGTKAVTAKLRAPESVAALADGGFLIADSGNSVIRKVDPAGVISTVAGVGFAGSGSPDGRAENSALSSPGGVAVLPQGGYLIADTGNHLVREVHPNGRISTIAGTGVDASTGDGRFALRASLRAPQGLAVAADGTIYVADPVANRIRRISPGGRIDTFAGTGQAGFSGDGGPAAGAQLNYPTDVAVRPDGSVLIADEANYRVRSVASDGTITTVAGAAPNMTGGGTTGGGAMLATQLQLNGPTGVVSMPDGGFAIADGPVVERVAPDLSAKVVAGTGQPVYNATAGPATSTGLADATAVAEQPDGSILIADANTDRVRKLDGNAILSTVAGSGTPQLLVTVGSSACPNPDQRGAWYVLDIIPWIGHPVSPSGRPIRVTVESSLRAWLVVTVRRGNRPITARQAVFNSGRHLVQMARAPAPGSYDVTVRGAAELHGRVLRNCAETFLSVSGR